jgi:hypothetical protein
MPFNFLSSYAVHLVTLNLALVDDDLTVGLLLVLNQHISDALESRL